MLFWAFGVVRAGFAGAMGPGRRGVQVVEMLVLRALICAGVEPSRDIFVFGFGFVIVFGSALVVVEKGASARSECGGDVNGGLSMPGLGAIRNF